MVTIDYDGFSTKLTIILMIELGIWVIRATGNFIRSGDTFQGKWLLRCASKTEETEETVEIVETVETVETIETVETVETVETKETKETEDTETTEEIEDLKKCHLLTD